MTFNGASIFGTQPSQNGPTRPYRSQDAQLPGVDGLRTYRLGKGVKTWVVSGRLTATTLALVTGLVEAGIAFVNGQLHTFVDVGGTAYLNCQLTEFRQIGRYESGTQDGNSIVTVRISATIRQLTP